MAARNPETTPFGLDDVKRTDFLREGVRQICNAHLDNVVSIELTTCYASAVVVHDGRRGLHALFQAHRKGNIDEQAFGYFTPEYPTRFVIAPSTQRTAAYYLPPEGRREVRASTIQSGIDITEHAPKRQATTIRIPNILSTKLEETNTPRQQAIMQTLERDLRDLSQCEPIVATTAAFNNEIVACLPPEFR